MALAKKCDRCGMLYEYHDNVLFNNKIVNGIHTVYTTEELNNHTQQHYDLCEKCCFSIYKWLTEPDSEVVLHKHSPMGNSCEVL